jgi:predicted ATP-dependent protease
MAEFFWYLIAISVFVGVLSATPKSPISERLAITGAFHASYQ